jgi:hypothetical protein
LCGIAAGDAAWRIVTSRSPEAKRSTQLISIRAKKTGFDALIYTSVRAPIDVIMPEHNMVVFSPNMLRHGLPSSTLGR